MAATRRALLIVLLLTSAVVGWLDADPRFGDIAVFGHSRRGKTALWTGALDDRVDFVWAHQSGTAGATLSRSYNGESVAAINARRCCRSPTSSPM